VVDRQPAPALETSFANAGEVSPGYSSPWAGPGRAGQGDQVAADADGPLVIRPKLDPRMWLWGLQLLRNCTEARYAVNKGRMVPPRRVQPRPPETTARRDRHPV
jgi:D-amino-acid dehydrogenase